MKFIDSYTSNNSGFQLDIVGMALQEIPVAIAEC